MILIRVQQAGAMHVHSGARGGSAGVAVQPDGGDGNSAASSREIAATNHEVAADRLPSPLTADTLLKLGRKLYATAARPANVRLFFSAPVCCSAPEPGTQHQHQQRHTASARRISVWSRRDDRDGASVHRV